MSKIKGVPVSDCTKFVWFVIHKLPNIHQTTVTLDNEDLFQTGFIELMRISDKIKNDSNWIKHPFVYKSIRWKLIKELNKYSRIVNVNKKIYEDLRALKQKFKNTEYDSAEHGLLFDRINEDFSGKYNRKDLDICQKLANYGHCGEFEIVREKLSVNPKNSYIEESLLNFIKSLNIAELRKKIFILKYGIDCDKLPVRKIMELLGVSQHYVYHSLIHIRDLMLMNGWLSEEFGQALAKKIRIRRYA